MIKEQIQSGEAIGPEQVQDLVRKHYGKKVRVSKLVGELDLNFLLADEQEAKFVLKIAHAGENLPGLEMQNAMIRKLGVAAAGLQVQQIIPSLNGEEIINLNEADGSTRYMRMLSWIEGKPLAAFAPHSDSLLAAVGAFCGKLCAALAGFDHPAAHRFMKWDPSQAAWIKDHLKKFKGPEQELTGYFYGLFEEKLLPALPSLRMSVNYNDANDYNVLVSLQGEEGRVSGVIDFGDAVYTHTVNELAVAIAYAAMDKPDPLAAACCLVRGFHAEFPLQEAEISILYPLVAIRLVISVVCAELNRTDDPENHYLQISDAPAWKLLRQWRNIHSDFAEACFRDACGLIPFSVEENFYDWIKKNPGLAISPLPLEKFSWLDLSISSADLGNYSSLNDPDSLDKTIDALCREKSSGICLGKYDEARAIYNGPAFESEGNEGPERRTVHIGLDFFSAAGTPIITPLDGSVHSFADNRGSGDYGPTIILEHQVARGLRFFTLYGHLSESSLHGLRMGKTFRAGEKLAEIGSRPANGDWTPHLHFQIILKMLGRSGDFPGVCKPADSRVWKSNCPDPWLLIRGEKTPGVQEPTDAEILAYRKQHLGKNLSISYKSPIRMVRGAGQFLLDQSGNRYLDTVNNVAHVGHEHPRVVRAGQRQMALLNTNTRYLHPNIIHFVKELLSTLPPALDVAFLVNSGSEANELGMRLARNFTGQKDMIVSEHGYHGNTNACIEISSYKFDGPGGRGPAPHIHAIPIPDTYRGLYRADDPQAAGKYAGHVKQAIEAMDRDNRKPAALILESVISCGGQVVLPEGFLAAAYAHTRAAGGLCLADEVQTGCGRAGDHFWAFQAHGVVPDIVTIGKPIGNGHPLGVVVTTQAIADAFRNGMEYFNTFGGNPVSSVIGWEVLNVIRDEGLQENARLVGEYLRSGLRELMQEFPLIGDLRGPGLFIGFELVRDRTTKEPATAEAAYFINRMRKKNILMSTDGPYNNVLKIKPPIVFSRADADFLLDAIRRVLREDFLQSAH